MLLHQPCIVMTEHRGLREASLLQVEFETERVFVRFKEEDGSLASCSGWFPLERVQLTDTA